MLLMKVKRYMLGFLITIFVCCMFSMAASATYVEPALSGVNTEEEELVFADDGINLYSSASRSTYKTFLCIADGVELLVHLTGNYEVDIDNDIITKVSSYSPSVEIIRYGDVTSPNAHYTVSNVRRSARYTSNRATFTATFDVYVTYGAYDTKEYCGTYTIFIVGGVNGGEAIDYTNKSEGSRYPIVNSQ